MFEYLFTVFDIPLVCILIILSLFAILLIKNIYNIFLLLFTSIFIIIFIASTMLTQQIYLGEFLVISIFFILTLIFFVFNLNKNYDDSLIVENKISKLKVSATIFIFVSIFSIIGINFNKINNSNSKFITNNLVLNDDLNVLDNKKERAYNSYTENISLLNQNRIFQKLTHIVMFYVCLVIVLYFFNKNSDVDKENQEGNRNLKNDELEKLLSDLDDDNLDLNDDDLEEENNYELDDGLEDKKSKDRGSEKK